MKLEDVRTLADAITFYRPPPPIKQPHWELTGESSADALRATVSFNATKTEVDKLEQKFLGLFSKL